MHYGVTASRGLYTRKFTKSSNLLTAAWASWLGSDEIRANAFNEILRDSSVKAIFFALALFLSNSGQD